MVNKQDYILARQDLVNLNLPMNFLRRWCESENRDFNNFVILVNTVHSMQSPLLPQEFSPQRKFVTDLIDYLDRKYKVTLVYSKQQNLVKCI